MCTKNQCFEQKKKKEKEKYQNCSTKFFQFLQVQKILYITRACFHNGLGIYQ